MKSEIPLKPIKNEILDSIKNKEIKMSFEKCESVMAAGLVINTEILNEDMNIFFESGQKLELPMPFDIRADNNKVIIDYSIKAFKNNICHECKEELPELIDNILQREHQNLKKSKFFDTRIIITTNK